VINDADATAVAADVCSDLVGADNVITSSPPGTGSEDFSFMSEALPGCYLILGNGDGSQPLHNPDYDFNDEALVYGASFFARVIESTLTNDASD
jgi:hippurate hydrolase